MIPYQKERHESSGGSNLNLEKIIIDQETRIAWKVSKYGVFTGPYFHAVEKWVCKNQTNH